MFDNVLQSMLHHSFMQLCDAMERAIDGGATEDDKKFLGSFISKTREGIEQQRAQQEMQAQGQAFDPGMFSDVAPTTESFAPIGGDTNENEELTPVVRVVDGEDEAAD